jgi:hypothetical protein
MSSNRAKAGGEIGINGEHYDGGQFLPNTTLGKMTPRSRSHAPRKCEIAPYTWEIAPEGMASIYSLFAGIFGKIINGQMIVSCNDTTLVYYHRTREQVQSMADRYNNGERWTPIK